VIRQREFSWTGQSGARAHHTWAYGSMPSLFEVNEFCNFFLPSLNVSGIFNSETGSLSEDFRQHVL